MAYLGGKTKNVTSCDNVFLTNILLASDAAKNLNVKVKQHLSFLLRVISAVYLFYLGFFLCQPYENTFFILPSDKFFLFQLLLYRKALLRQILTFLYPPVQENHRDKDSRRIIFVRDPAAQ